MKPDIPPSPLELWAGIECTVNRVHDTFFDQLDVNGHARRENDLDRIAALGIRTLRYPLLWERTAPDSLERPDWTWGDERMARLRELHIAPIVGLVHHGSGPRGTSLVQPSFAEGLARYAGMAAQRYPWVRDYTPVNEPLTTARFSGLYGHWYPHGHDEPTFVRALLMECRATVLAMRAIREVNSEACLIQTDDLGRTYSTPAMQYQADFENERRWLTWDLLSGCVDSQHPLWDYLLWAGTTERELGWFVDNPCPPDILGVNHYLTSERFLDEHSERYPEYCEGSNGRDRYADVEAVRVLKDGAAGIKGVLQEAWARYGRPLAVTEAHLGCTREEQMRWLLDVWQSAQELNESGVDVRAVTLWAVLGSYDWDSLLTRRQGHYEPGVFDLRSDPPRPTRLARMATQMAAGCTPDHPALDSPGWWHQPSRLLYAPAEVVVQNPAIAPENARGNTPPRPLLITGAATPLGAAFVRLCDMRGLACHTQNDLPAEEIGTLHLSALLRDVRPWAVIHADAAVSHASDLRHTKEELSEAVNRSGETAIKLAHACARQGLPLLHFTSDQVFGGKVNGKEQPYGESAALSPASEAGRGEMRTEQRVRSLLPAALIARTSLLFGPWDTQNPVSSALQAFVEGRGYRERDRSEDTAIISPTYVCDLVHACLDLLLDGETGVWHLANRGEIALWEFLGIAAQQAGLPDEAFAFHAHHASRRAAPLPGYRALASERGQIMPALETALQCFLRDSGNPWRTAWYERSASVAA